MQFLISINKSSSYQGGHDVCVSMAILINTGLYEYNNVSINFCLLWNYCRRYKYFWKHRGSLIWCVY